MDQITINRIGENYWYVPSIFTVSRRLWHQRPYKSLKQLLSNEKHLKENLIVRLNGDKDLETFKTLQQIKGFPLNLNNAQLNLLEAGKTINIKILDLKPQLYFDRKSLKHIKRGFLPFYSIRFLNKEFKNDLAIIYRKSGYIVYKKK